MAYNGWSYVSFVAGEVRDPQRNLLRSLVIGMAAVSVLYVSANLAYLKVMTIAQIAATERVAAELATRTMGPIGGDLRFPVRAAIDHRRGQRLHPDGGAHPVRAGAGPAVFRSLRRSASAISDAGPGDHLQRIWTSILVLTGSYETLYSYSILAAWIFYTMTVAAVFVLRRKLPDAKRPYRMWGYP